MGTRIKFDSMGNIQEATIVLATRSGKKLGNIPAHDIVFKECLNSYSEVSFKVNKYDNGIECRLWNQIKNFKLVYCPEWDLWFEIKLDINESNDVSKSVSGKTICESELSQIMLYDIEINTETDISRDDYLEPTIIFNEESPESSLLNRIMEKAPHYRIISVDASVAEMQRTFSFDGTSLYDAFQQIAEEVGCLFVFGSGSDENGLPARTIEVRDLINSCRDCYYREENMTVCPKCGSQNIVSGYGSDTGIFVSTENLADEITYSTDTDSVKNCFKIEGGDDLINATVRNCNPNGTDYIWYISDAVKEDMSDELVGKIEAYDNAYSEHQNTKSIDIDASSITKYNSLVTKYKDMYDAQNDEKLQQAISPIIGYSSLMNLYYDVVDLSMFLQSGMMPSPETSGTTAEKQAALLTSANLSPVAVTSSTISKATAENAVLGLAKVYVKSSYQVKINNSNLTGTVWSGNFVVTNISDDEDSATSASISVNITTNIESYVEQKMKKALKKSETDDLSIVGLFDLEATKFKSELKKYCLDSLMIFNNACQGCLDVMIEQGYASGDTADTYAIYEDYYNKSKYIQSEVALREDEIEIIEGVYNSDGALITYGIENHIIEARNAIQKFLNFEEYLGEDLWHEFCVYRREDKYLNSNYISDGLNNAELFAKARELFEVATKEIYKSAELQHSISSSIKNLLAMKEFKSLVDWFAVGNWIRVKVDNEVYKLRLISYEIDYSDFSNSSVEFSDILKVTTGTSDVQSIIQQAASIASSYSGVVHQASQGANSNKIVSKWVSKGLALTNSYISNSENQELKMDSNGFLMREWLPITETYTDKQLKIINKGLYITDDGWKTAKTGIGEFVYYDYDTDNKWTQYMGHGVIADTLVGSLILGERMGIYTDDNNIHMNKNGLTVTNGTNTVSINPNQSTNVFTISKGSNQKFYINNNGNIYMDGNIYLDGGYVAFRDSAKNTLVEIDSAGQTFYGEDSSGDQIVIGTIGDTSWTEDDTAYGLGFNSTKEASFMSWGVWESTTSSDEDEESGYYNTVMLYVFPDKTLTATTGGTDILEGLNFYTPVRMNWNILYFGDYTCITPTTASDGQGVEFRIPYVANEKNYYSFTTKRNGLWTHVLQIAQRNNITSELTIYNNTYIDIYDDIHMNGYKIEGASVTENSDARLKTNIADCEQSAVDILNKINIKSFDWIESGEHESMGLIAQQLEEVVPELVLTNEETTMKSIYFTKFIPYLIKAIQELSESKNKKGTRKSWKDSIILSEKESFIEDRNKKINPIGLSVQDKASGLVQNNKFKTYSKTSNIGGKNDRRQ